ncbi:MAG: HAMP domain-containing histidine kinase, partial [Anaerolineae bacterium]|nr:HAMP domain-containing histidine kinase [Anaerolineae bacterium]
MTGPLQPTLTLEQAMEILVRLQSAAPKATAEKLGQVRQLLQHLTSENVYFHTLMLEGLPDAPASEVAAPSMPEPPEPEEDEPSLAAEASISEALASEASVQLVRGINDALRPPLVAIRGRAELVQAGFLGQVTPEQDTWLQAINENTARAFAILDALQEMIAIQRGQVRLDPVNFLSTDLLAEAWERLRDRAHQLNHDVTIQAPDVVPLARGDFYQSLIVLTDLLDNALRYTPPGGQIRLTVDNLGTHVLFSVADNGIGLTADDLEQVGKAFWRGDHHRLVRSHPGTGLRLYLAQHVLALQDGELIFSGEPDVG